MPRASQVCSVPGCPELAPCRIHRLAPTSSRNHGGVARQARGHGADYDRDARAFAGARCELRLEGCTEVATGADYEVPGDWTSRRRPACAHCQRVQGGRIALAARRAS